MKKLNSSQVGGIAFVVAAGLVAALGPLGGCTDLSAACANATVKPGASCQNDSLQCPYSLDQPNCDGTSTTIASSCVCQQGAWACPSPAACPEPTDDGGDDGATDDGSSDAADDTTADDATADAPVDDGSSDAPADVASDVTCNSPDIPCNGTCVNPLIDKMNCGYCGHKCLGNQSCSNGSCI